MSADKMAQLPLPEFSTVVRGFLEGSEEIPRGIWLRAVKEAARFYLREYPSLKESNVYQNIGERLFARYPRIGCSGKKPWKTFTKSLSQRIRHVRYMRLRAQRGCEDIWELERDVYMNRERRGGGDVANVYLDRDSVSSLPPPSQQ